MVFLNREIENRMMAWPWIIGVTSARLCIADMFGIIAASESLG